MTSAAQLFTGAIGDTVDVYALFDIRPLSLFLGDAVLCMCSWERYMPDGDEQPRRLQGLRRAEVTVAGWLADLSKRRREAGVVNADLRLSNSAGAITREIYVGQSGRTLDITVAKVDGLYSLHGSRAFPPGAATQSLSGRRHQTHAWLRLFPGSISGSPDARRMADDLSTFGFFECRSGRVNSAYGLGRPGNVHILVHTDFRFPANTKPNQVVA